MRPSWDTYFLKLAFDVSARATCSRRKVGAILVNACHQILSTGYNGSASGLTNCIEHPCLGASYESGKGLEYCEAIHAEQNALLQCADVYKIHTLYTTTTPCLYCVKLLLNTSCSRIVSSSHYIAHHDAAKALFLKKAGTEWNIIDIQ